MNFTDWYWQVLQLYNYLHSPNLTAMSGHMSKRWLDYDWLMAVRERGK